MTTLTITPATTMRKIYSEEYRFLNRDFKIVAFRDKSRITVKIYEVLAGKPRIIPQFEASFHLDLADDVDLSKSAMFHKIINASKLFVQNFQ